MYVQHNGVAMGAPISPIIADVFMAHLEDSLMDRLKDCGVKVWHQFVDDTFVLVDPKSNINDILSILNTCHESIKFTYEVEQRGLLSFLDVKVQRTLTKMISKLKPEEEIKLTFETKVNRKNTYTGLMTNWYSFVPLQYKKGSIVNMIQRAISICSNYHFLVSELDHIRKVCLANQYPSSFIERCIGIRLSKYMKQQQQQLNNEETPLLGCPKERIYFELPYLGRTTDVLKEQFKRIVNKYKPALDARFYILNLLQLSTHFSR